MGHYTGSQQRKDQSVIRTPAKSRTVSCTSRDIINGDYIDYGTIDCTIIERNHCVNNVCHAGLDVYTGWRKAEYDRETRRNAFTDASTSKRLDLTRQSVDRELVCERGFGRTDLPKQGAFDALYECWHHIGEAEGQSPKVGPR